MKKGRKLSEAHKKNIKIALENLKVKRKMSEPNIGNKSHNWKGNEANYHTIHEWVRRWKGKADHCEICKSIEEHNKYEWANKDHKYRRVLSDYISMCKKCHSHYDMAVNNK